VLNPKSSGIDLKVAYHGSFDQELEVTRLSLPIGEGGVMPGSPSEEPNPNFKKHISDTPVVTST
jgi:hypothetical protein